MIPVQTSTPFEAVCSAYPTGLVGTLGVRIIDNEGGTFLSRQTAGITEPIADSGIYTVTLLSPPTAGQWSIVWDDGSTDPSGFAEEDLFVYTASSETPALPPLGPVSTEGGPTPGPCSAWTDAEAIAACCGAAVGSDTSLYDTVAIDASRVLYELSGRQFNGLCTLTARPCRVGCGCWPSSSLVAHEWSVGWDTGWWWGNGAGGWGWRCGEGSPCGCGSLSRVLLPGYPVREILEVIIGGEVLDPVFDDGAPTWRIDDWRYLTRMSDPDDPDVRLLWPACQRLDLPATEPGTWQVTYTSGETPPELAQSAAAQLACQLYLACSPVQADLDECVLPSGVTKIERQGVTIEMSAFNSWARDPKSGAWRTGLSLVDAFLNTYNPNGLRRRPAMWSPDGPRYAKRVGTVGGS